MSYEKLEKILFVDDEESILAIASEYFNQKGYTVVTAQNGLEAVEVLKNHKVDCCFTDINMPEMDGLQLAEYIYKSDNTIPVIIMTGFPSMDNTIRTLKNGVVDFLVKPVNLNQMELCVRRVFKQRKLFVENMILQKEADGKARLENLNKELIIKVEELNILNKILTDFTGISSTSGVFQKLADMAVRITHSDEAGFYIINEDVKKPFQVAGSILKDPDCICDEPSSRRPMSNSEQGTQGGIDHLIMEIASDEIPLLVSANNGSSDFPQHLRSIIMVPLKIRNRVFGVLCSLVKSGKHRFSEKDLYYLSFMCQNAVNAIENLALYENIYENLFATLYAFVNAIEVRDPYTRQHSSRVTQISILIGKEMGCASEELDILKFSGHLHDIGKIGIRDDILLKPGRLTKEEFEKIKEHPIIGANIVERLGLWEQERQIIRWHHERFDGTGYPDGLNRNEIPLLARIMSVADVYDAISSDRSYRKRMPEDKILQIITEGAGTQFDPDIVKVFLKLYHGGAFKPITGLEQNTKKEARTSA